MRAIIQTRYGDPEDVLELREIDTPAPGDDEVLVRVRAASVHADVWHVVAGFPLILRVMGAGLLRPRDPVPGTDLAGVVQSVGRDVQRFEPGDEVFGETLRGMQWRNGGAFAEYAAVPQDMLALKPEGISFEEAASVPTAGYIAVTNLPRDAQFFSGKRVLINGAGGGVGSIALQVARAHGAHVTGIDEANKLEMLRSLGADHVIDYAREDFTRGQERYDLIFDVASTLSLADAKRAMTPTGTYVIIGHDHYGSVGRHVFGSLPKMLGLMVRAPLDRHLPRVDFSLPEKEDVMTLLKELLVAEKLTPIVGRVFPLSEAREAISCLRAGRTVGKIILTPWQPRQPL